MRASFKIIVVILGVLLFFSCNSQYSKEENIPESQRLFRKYSQVMLRGLELELKDSSDYILYYKEAIAGFFSAFSLDTTNIRLLIYQSDLYSGLGQYDSALFWGLKLLPLDSVMAQQQGAEDYGIAIQKIGFYYLELGDTIAGRTYLIKSKEIDKSGLGISVQRLIDLSNKWYDNAQSSSENRSAFCQLGMAILRMAYEFESLDESKRDLSFYSDRNRYRALRCE